MGVIKFILRLFGWLLTIILQIAAAFLIVFLFTIIFAGVDTTSRLGWLESLFVIWLGDVIGINLVGMAAMRLVWKEYRVLMAPRLIGTMVGALIPFLILMLIGYRVPVGDAGTPFYDLVTNYWQPILTQAALFTAIVGYYFPNFL
jgi:hypothetical protein